MRQLLDLTKFELAMQIIAVAALPVGLGGGALLGWLRGQIRYWLIRGGAVGLLGPIFYIMWCYYRWMVRLDPEAGYVGLHKPSILFLNIAVFVAFGVVLGLLYGKVLRGNKESDNEH